jgi:hypothetical protein
MLQLRAQSEIIPSIECSFQHAGLPPGSSTGRPGSMCTNTSLLYQHSLVPNTRAAYKSGTNSFIEFCLLYRRFTPLHSILPATEETLVLFASYLSLKVTSETISLFVSGTEYHTIMHTEAEFSDLFKNLTLLPKLVQGIKQLYSQERCPRLPITPQILMCFRKYLHLPPSFTGMITNSYGQPCRSHAHFLVSYVPWSCAASTLQGGCTYTRSWQTTIPPTFGIRFRSSGPKQTSLVRAP